MRRRPRQSVLAEPVLVGAVTTLVVIVAVFLAYNANKGLPFVPTTDITVDLPDGAALVPQNEVREGGHRIGIIDRMEPVRLPDGRVGARVFLKIDGQVPALPVDSTAAVRPRSSLSLKYLEIRRGKARATIADGARLGVDNARRYVELDEVLNAFDEPTREGQRRNLRGFGDALAGRGQDLNHFLAELPRFLGELEPVAQTLGAPETGLRTLLRELGDAARVVRPVAEEYAEGFADQATTFEALARDPDALRATIERTPSTLRTGRRSFVVQRPFLEDLRGLSADLEVAARRVTAAAPAVTRAFRVAGPINRRSAQLNRRLEVALRELGGLSRDPSTVPAIRQLGALVTTLQPQLRYLGPHVTVCNGFTKYWTFNAEHLSEPDPTGTSERVHSVNAPQQSNSLGSMGAVKPANGEGHRGEGAAAFFHGQPYGRAVDEQGNADCENWNRGYPRRLAKFTSERFQVAADPRTPGSQGPGFDHFTVDHGHLKGHGLGPLRVPEGQTFAAEPQTGAQVP